MAGGPGVSTIVILNLSTLSEPGLDRWLTAELSRSLGALGADNRIWPELPLAPGAPGRPGLVSCWGSGLIKFGAGAAVLTAAAGGLALASHTLGQGVPLTSPSISSPTRGAVESGHGSVASASSSANANVYSGDGGPSDRPTGRHRYDLGLTAPGASGLLGPTTVVPGAKRATPRRPVAGASTINHQGQSADPAQPPPAKETHR